MTQSNALKLLLKFGLLVFFWQFSPPFAFIVGLLLAIKFLFTK